MLPVWDLGECRSTQPVRYRFGSPTPLRVEAHEGAARWGAVALLLHWVEAHEGAARWGAVRGGAAAALGAGPSPCTPLMYAFRFGYL